MARQHRVLSSSLLRDKYSNLEVELAFPIGRGDNNHSITELIHPTLEPANTFPPTFKPLPETRPQLLYCTFMRVEVLS